MSLREETSPSLTRWSIVERAKDFTSPDAFEALSQLCEIYRPSIFAFLCRRNSPHDAEDFTQGFFAHLLRRDFLKNVDKTKGRFRNFLLQCLKNYLLNQREMQSRRPMLVPLGAMPFRNCPKVLMRFENRPKYNVLKISILHLYFCA